jgi:hypothetical protein
MIRTVAREAARRMSVSARAHAKERCSGELLFAERPESGQNLWRTFCPSGAQTARAFGHSSRLVQAYEGSIAFDAMCKMS